MSKKICWKLTGGEIRGEMDSDGKSCFRNKYSEAIKSDDNTTGLGPNRLFLSNHLFEPIPIWDNQ